MSDKINGLTVVLDHDVSSEDINLTIAAIRQIRRVLDVRPIVADFAAHMAEERAKRDLGEKLLDVVWPERRGRKGP